MPLSCGAARLRQRIQPRDDPCGLCVDHPLDVYARVCGPSQLSRARAPPPSCGALLLDGGPQRIELLLELVIIHLCKILILRCLPQLVEVRASCIRIFGIKRTHAEAGKLEEPPASQLRHAAPAVAQPFVLALPSLQVERGHTPETVREGRADGGRSGEIAHLEVKECTLEAPARLVVGKSLR